MTQPRVLVVDDEPGVLHAVQRILGRHAAVRCAQSPRQALELAAGFDPELAIVDLRMRELDGFELMARLKQGYPELDVVLMTGSVHEVDAQLARSLREAAFFFLQKPFERELLLTLFERWRQIRHLADENRRHTARLERELHDARAFQESMLPPRAARIGALRLEHRWLPCSDVGGDLVDWCDAGQGRVALLLADVSGHGVRAAMLTGIVKSALVAAHVDDFAPAAVVRRVHQGMRAFADDLFVTLFCGRFDPAAGALELASAGHGKAAWIPRGGVPEVLPLTGPVVASAAAVLPVTTRRLEIGAGRLLLWTDGIDETPDPDGELFGDERVVALAKAGAPSGGALLDGILAAVEEFRAGRPLRDDCTLVAAELRG